VLLAAHEAETTRRCAGREKSDAEDAEELHFGDMDWYVLVVEGVGREDGSR